MQRALTLGMILCGAATAHADVSVGVQLTPAGQMLAHQLGVSPDALAAQLRDRVDSVMGTDGPSLRRFSDAAVLARSTTRTGATSAP